MTYEMGDHTVHYGPMQEAPIHSVNLFFFDSPGMSPDVSFGEARQFFIETFQAIERMRHWDSVLFLVARDGKGHPFQKSVVSAYVAQEMGWNVFRQFTWLSTAGDFHRSRYAAQGVWAMRKGNVPAIESSPYRYKDIIRAKEDMSSTGMVQALPADLIVPLLQLFAVPRMTVCDPFAGSGSVMDAAEILNLKSVSIEIDLSRAQALLRKAEKYQCQKQLTLIPTSNPAA